MRVGKIHKPFLIWTVILVVLGFFIFCSASLGVLARNEIKFSNVAFNQVFYGLFLGSISCLLFANIDYHNWKKYSFFLFIGSIILTLLVFVPHIGMEHGGARRWLDFRFVTLQPSELLKISFIMYYAAWLTKFKNKTSTISHGLVPFLAFITIMGVILLKQPDTDTLAVSIFAALSMYLTSGAKWRHILFIFIGGILLAVLLYFVRPYIKQRVDNLINPSLNSQTTGYQINQSLIAVGSGRLWGRGFGQSIQKFHNLPEPIGDSIFAVAAEEFGFIGSIIILSIFIMFGLEGLKIASRSPDDFGRLLSLGIVIIIVSQALINIGGMIGVLPLMGITLPFISQGGTSLFITLTEAGIVMNISRSSKKQ